MATRLREYAVLDNRVAEGHLFALGQGDVLTDALLEAGEDEVSKIRGRVLGGGVVTKSRGFGLVVRDEFTSVKTSSRIGEAVNRRFNVYHNGSKQGVANPKRDNFIELLVHPRYVGNEVRYIRVIQNIAVREAPRVRSVRLNQLKSQMADPSTAALAAVQLEAIGEAGIPTLRDALDSKDLEIRFYAAEALAYLDVPDAVEALDAAIRREPAFRWRALTALGAMDDVAAHEALIGLLHVASAESRYGAFRVLRRRTPDDPMIDGEVVNDSFSMHQVSTTGPPLIHVSRIERPEIVFFGSDHEFAEPVVLFAGNEIVVRSNQTDGVSVSRLSAGGEDASVDCSRRVTDVVRAIAQLEGTYADVVHALTEARRNGCLKSRLEFSAIPTTGRSYRRGTTEEDLPGEDQLPPESPGAEPPDLRPGPIDLATDDRSPDDLSNDQPSQRLTAGLPSENPGRADSDPPRSAAASPASEPSVESSTRLLHDLPAAAGAAAAALRPAPRLVPTATTTGTATLIPNDAGPRRFQRQRPAWIQAVRPCLRTRSPANYGEPPGQRLRRRRRDWVLRGNRKAW